MQRSSKAYEKNSQLKVAVPEATQMIELVDRNLKLL